MNNIMLDLETLSTKSNAAIIAIGATRFDHYGIIDRFYEIVDLTSFDPQLFDIDLATIGWWMQQSDKAREIFNQPNKAARLQIILHNFLSWIGNKAIIWGNGSDFDNVILANAYRSMDIPVPWEYNNNRCYRTVKNLYPNITIEREGTLHNALHDAIYQTDHLLEILWHVNTDLLRSKKTHKNSQW